MTSFAAAAWGAGWPHLRYIFLDHIEDLAGTLPRSYGNWSELEHFSANWTGLQGTFPSSLAALSSLRNLHFSGTQFIGSLPDEWSSTALESIAVGFTNLSVSSSQPPARQLCCGCIEIP